MNHDLLKALAEGEREPQFTRWQYFRAGVVLAILVAAALLG